MPGYWNAHSDRDFEGEPWFDDDDTSEPFGGLCIECWGEGEVEGGDDAHVEIHTCKRCNGTGREPK